MLGFRKALPRLARNSATLRTGGLNAPLGGDQLGPAQKDGATFNSEGLQQVPESLRSLALRLVDALCPGRLGTLEPLRDLRTLRAPNPQDLQLKLYRPWNLLQAQRPKLRDRI